MWKIKGLRFEAGNPEKAGEWLESWLNNNLGWEPFSCVQASGMLWYAMVKSFEKHPYVPGTHDS